MSYDLMVFKPEAAPADGTDFMKWYQQQTQWLEGHDYDDPTVSDSRLQAWFLDMIIFFPQMNGPFADEEADIDDARLTDYSIGQEVIYAAFAWSVAADARHLVVALAEKHKVGFFDVSDDAAR